LFSLFGTTYGGDGRTNFNLPDLRGRVPVHTGQGPGLTDRRQGGAGGSESETLMASQAPTHNHEINISSSDATYSDGVNGVLGAASSNKKKKQPFIYDGPGTADQTLSAESVSDAGDGESHNNLPPYTTLRACVALVGIYPSRNPPPP
jgi:microcystin-dependent protein